MVRALAFHQSGPGSIPGPRVICGLSLLLVLVLDPRVFLRVLRFSSLHKNQHFQIAIRSGRQVFAREPLAREIRRLISHYDVEFNLPFFFYHLGGYLTIIHRSEGKYLPLFTDTEVNNCLSIMPNQWRRSAPNSSFSCEMRQNSRAKSSKMHAGRCIADTIPSLSSQSERARNTIHWFCIYQSDL